MPLSTLYRTLKGTRSLLFAKLGKLYVASKVLFHCLVQTLRAKFEWLVTSRLTPVVLGQSISDCSRA